jgi:hypothetical protein
MCRRCPRGLTTAAVIRLWVERCISGQGRTLRAGVAAGGRFGRVFGTLTFPTPGLATQVVGSLFIGRMGIVILGGGGHPTDSDASGGDQAQSAMESTPNTTNGDYTSYGDEVIRSPDDRPVQPSDANELPTDVPVSEATAQPKHKAADGG